MSISTYINNNNWCGDDDRINFPFFVIFFVFRVLYVPLGINYPLFVIFFEFRVLYVPLDNTDENDRKSVILTGHGITLKK